MLTHQEIFDRVATHLFTQGRPAMVDRNGRFICAYRGNGGARCAVGCLIPDTLYRPWIENKTVFDLLEDGLLGRFLPEVPAGAYSLLQSLQGVHDDQFDPQLPNERYDIAALEECLREVARASGISPAILDALLATRTPDGAK